MLVVIARGKEDGKEVVVSETVEPGNPDVGKFIFHEEDCAIESCSCKTEVTYVYRMVNNDAETLFEMVEFQDTTQQAADDAKLDTIDENMCVCDEIDLI